MTRTQNGITCEIDNDGASRWATFCTGKGAYLCSVQQDADPVNLVMDVCTFSWKSNSPGRFFKLINAAELMAEALRQAIELARIWEADAGKPIKDVLK